MKERLNAYFSRKNAVKVNLILATVLLAIVLVLDFIVATPGTVITNEALLLAVLWLVAICFFKHNVNGMQSALGAFLFGQLLAYALGVWNVQWPAFLPLVFSVIVFITHQYLISKRQSKSHALCVNQLAGALFMLGCVVNAVVVLTIHGLDADALSGVFYDLFTAAAMNMVITIESRINEYKIQRDALTTAGKWNDGAKAKLKKEIFG